ncbi:hypothetical protein MNEG_5126 [Monoraphidium neglectum]|uniref:Agd3 deacetylase domain-containing protein n=1 Tax=Monoraphidium neglectum TaxID=145388 RepID=A0A0D2MQY7_9CHLO|nr:hypothetical protein MNEG_5126 [Monoraphidium neglectum]KIZ02837.1 hypothetical protein MNEG_5126 [Monoraphidium neglectum]|eukprot:XP_013901856.1 hypothetical protein MNEG_5126 [Monoraphidium neglectum]
MHQANLNVEGTNKATGYSLAMRWIERVLTRVTAWVTWPVRSLKLDDLMALYRRREARDNCKLSYRLEVATASGAVQAVTVRSGGGACQAPLTVGAAASAAGGARDAVEAAAPVYRFDLAAGAVLRVATSGMAWAVPAAA